MLFNDLLGKLPLRGGLALLVIEKDEDHFLQLRIGDLHNPLASDYLLVQFDVLLLHLVSQDTDVNLQEV